MIIKFKKLVDDAQMPTYATKGAACFDLYARGWMFVEPGDVQMIKTGLSVEVPEGHAMMIYSRSGHGKLGVTLANSVGVIDSDYRGEICVMLTNQSCKTFDVQPGDRIAQGMIIPVNQVTFEEGELSDTERGTGGFGSTGK